MILRWLHIVGFALSTGAAFYFLFVFEPSLKTIDSPQERLKRFAGQLNKFHPTYLFGICLLFMSGAMRLTDMKLAFGNNYYHDLGSILMIKFGLTTLIFLIASGQCFGMGLKVTRMVNGIIEAPIERQEKLAMMIHRMTMANLILLLITAYEGLKIAPIIYGTP